MRPEIKKLILAKYKQMFKAYQLPYKQVKAGAPHRSTFECDLHEDLKLQAHLLWQTYDDQFALEVGWKYRSTQHDVTSAFDSKKALKCDAVCIGLAFVAGEEVTKWWDVRACYRSSFTELDDTNGQFVKLLEHSFQSLREIGIPYLARVVAKKLPAGLSDGTQS